MQYVCEIPGVNAKKSRPGPNVMTREILGDETPFCNMGECDSVQAITDQSPLRGNPLFLQVISRSLPTFALLEGIYSIYNILFI